MGEGVRAAFGLAGGLALFLFGMENMSRALQQAAGERMRGFLRRVTRTPGRWRGFWSQRCCKAARPPR